MDNTDLLSEKSLDDIKKIAVSMGLFPSDSLSKEDYLNYINYGNCKRDFTYIDDIVEGVKRVMQKAPERKNGEDGLPIPPYKVYRKNV